MAQASDPSWAGWSLPVDTNKALLSVSHYAEDSLAFAESFLVRCGFGQDAPRLAPAAVAGQSFKSAEEQNAALVAASFFRQRFT